MACLLARQQVAEPAAAPCSMAALPPASRGLVLPASGGVNQAGSAGLASRGDASHDATGGDHFQNITGGGGTPSCSPSSSDTMGFVDALDVASRPALPTDGMAGSGAGGGGAACGFGGTGMTAGALNCSEIQQRNHRRTMSAPGALSIPVY